MKKEWYQYTEQGGRLYNEDSMIVGQAGQEGWYAAVADGLGGHGLGKEASEIAVRWMSECWKEKSLPQEEQIRYWMNEANREILEKRPDRMQMKTTLVFLFLFGQEAIWSHVGDSRLYHFYNGKLVDYTKDHSVPQMAVALGEISRDQIPDSADRNRLLRVVGEAEFQPEIHPPVKLLPGNHAFLLCSDGFWEYLREYEIRFELEKADSAREWLERMRKRVRERGNQEADNHTAAAIWIMR